MDDIAGIGGRRKKFSGNPKRTDQQIEKSCQGTEGVCSV